MNRARPITFLCSLGLLGLVTAAQPVFAAQSKVYAIQLNDDTINPVTAEYIVTSVERAVEEGAQCLLIKMDTPGGLLTSTRQIVKKILTSAVPVVVYISPSGSRAGSAGVFITYASHIAAMAPSTNIGAAHPVEMGFGTPSPKREENWKELRGLVEELKQAKKGEGTEEDKKAAEPQDTDENPMRSKILNDTVAFIRSIAKERGRNVDWAVESVTKSASITDKEALEKGVIDVIADSDRDLLNKIDGRVVRIQGRDITLQTKDAVIEEAAMNSSQNFFNVLANPNIAYFLMILGFYGLLFEITHPGIGVPGILGAVFLILAFYSMQTLPTNYAGLALMVLGLVLLVAEAYTPTFGLLTLGGLACLILGSMLLFESVDPVMRVSRSVIFAFSFTTAGITFFLLQSVIRVHRAKAASGKEGLVGSAGEARTAIRSRRSGKVFIHGELWNAVSDEEIQKGDEVTVTGIQGLVLRIQKRNKGLKG